MTTAKPLRCACRQPWLTVMTSFSCTLPASARYAVNCRQAGLQASSDDHALAKCFVLGVALILSAVWCSAVILSGERAVFILVVWIIVGAYLIVRAYTCARTRTPARVSRSRS